MRFVAILFVALLFCACREDKMPSLAPEPPTSSTVPAADVAGRPQPKLRTLKLWVGTNELTAEIASTRLEIQTGMMWRTNMAEMEGMLFVFPFPQSVSFYMRNTLVPLSCAYINPEGTVLETYDMQPRDETPIPSRSSEVLYVLEVNQGWFERHDVRPGMLVRSEYGPLSQTFRPRR